MIAADFVRAGHERLAVHHQRHVEARAAHVGGDDVGVANLLRQLQRAHHAAGGSACHQEDGLRAASRAGTTPPAELSTLNFPRKPRSRSRLSMRSR